MSVTITAVPVVQGGLDAGPAAGPIVGRPSPDFVASLQNGSASGMPQLANPAALASELFGSLRGYFERARNFERMPTKARGGADGDGFHVASTSVASEPRAGLHGGPARENLEPADINTAANTGASSAVEISLDQLQRVMDLALTSMNFATETALVVRGTSQISHSANTLLKGQ